MTASAPVLVEQVTVGDSLPELGVDVTDVTTDATGCAWVSLDVALTVAAVGDAGDRVASTCEVRIAVPTTPDDNPWSRSGDQWTP